MTLAIPGYDGAEPLGSGGYAKVWRAYQPGFSRYVAIKVLAFDVVDERAIRAFERECQAMGKLGAHPNIVTVLDNGVTAGNQPYIVMEYFPKGTYSDKVREGPLSPEAVLKVGVKISGALQACHDAGILHRDIKPHNIFVSGYDEPALGDFGISTFETERTSTSEAAFTVHYAPPEVLNGLLATVQSDLYSLGATLYRLVEGVRPFDGSEQSVVTTAVRVINEPSPVVMRPDCPDPLKRLIARLMSKDASDRPQSAADLAVEFQAMQSAFGFPVSELLLMSTESADSGSRLSPSSAAATIQRSSIEPPTESAASLTISRPVESRVPDGSDETTGPDSDGARNGTAMWLVAAAAVVAILVSLVGWAVVSDGGTPPALSSTTISTASNDGLFGQPTTPRDVLVVYDGATAVEVSWTNRTESDEDLFLVTRTDVGAGANPTVEATGSPVRVTGINRGETPCFTVSMVRGGRVSAPSREACANT